MCIAALFVLISSVSILCVLAIWAAPGQVNVHRIRRIPVWLVIGLVAGIFVALLQLALFPGAVQFYVLATLGRAALFFALDVACDPWFYFFKAGLVIRASGQSVFVTVPRAWRGRAAIAWGYGGKGVFQSLRFAGCKALPSQGFAYSGGFYLRSAGGCLPLVFRVGRRSATVRFGLGRRCGSFPGVKRPFRRWRTIDLYEGDRVNESSLKVLVRAGVDFNRARVKSAAKKNAAK